jgi:hypothetical protein
MDEWLPELASWAWARHHNILSWYVRPLFFLPFCFFALPAQPARARADAPRARDVDRLVPRGPPIPTR